MMKILDKPEFYKEFAFMSCTPQEMEDQGKLLTKFINREESYKIEEKLFWTSRILRNYTKSIPDHHNIQLSLHPIGYKWRGGQAGNVPRKKIGWAKEYARAEMVKLGYRAPLYYGKICRLHGYENNYEFNKEIKQTLEVYCK